MSGAVEPVGRGASIAAAAAAAAPPAMVSGVLQREREGRRHEENKVFGAADASGNLEGKYANWDSLGFQGALPKLICFFLLRQSFLRMVIVEGRESNLRFANYEYSCLHQLLPMHMYDYDFSPLFLKRMNAKAIHLPAGASVIIFRKGFLQGALLNR